MKKYIPSLKEYSAKKEIGRLNEGLISSAIGAVKTALKKVGQWFSGLGSRFLNQIVAQQSGKLHPNVVVFAGDYDKKILSEHGITYEDPFPVTDMQLESNLPLVGATSLNEAKVDLTSKSVRNATVDQVIEEIDLSMWAIHNQNNYRRTVLIWGPPGIGKTQICAEIAKNWGGRIIDLQVANMSPEDFFLPATISAEEYARRIGKPNPSEYDRRSTRIPIDTLPVYHKDDPEGDAFANGPDGKGGILFLDELSRALQPTQDVCLKLINERRLDNYVLGSKWAIVSAANRQDDEISDRPFNWSTALNNRFNVQMNLVADPETWGKWAAKKDYIDHTLIDFLKFNRGEFYNLDNEDDSSKPYASPRSWDDAAMNLDLKRKKLGRDLTIQEIQDTLESAVGHSASIAYTEFVKLIREINPKDVELVYTDPSKAPKYPKDKNGITKSGIALAWSTAIGDYKKDQKVTASDIENVFQYLCDAKEPSWAPVAAVSFLRNHDAYMLSNKDLKAARGEAFMKFLKAYPDFVNNNNAVDAYNRHTKQQGNQ